MAPGGRDVGEPPFWVRWNDGKTTLLIPAGDAVVEPVPFKELLTKTPRRRAAV